MPVKILVADDSVTMRRIMEMTFAGEDAEVVTVESGESAVQRAQEVQPDVVFADLSMRGMDGYGVSHAIKSIPALANTATIVMASQHLAFDEGKGQDAGVDDHIVKPFDSQIVINKVAEVLRRPRMVPAGAAPAASTHAAPPAPPATPKKAAPKHTVAFGQMPSPGGRPAPPAPPAPPARPVLELADEPIIEVETRTPTPAPAPAAPRAAVHRATSQGSPLASKLDGLGLTPGQLEGVLSLSREVIEQVVWEVVPDLAEAIIREELKRLTAE